MGRGLVAVAAGPVAEVEELWFAWLIHPAAPDAQLPPSPTLVAKHLGRNSGGLRPCTRVGNHTPSDWGPPAQEALVHVPDITILGAVPPHAIIYGQVILEML